MSLSAQGERPGARAAAAGLLPLSHGQAAMWIQWKYDESSAAYNNPLLFALEGDVDSARLGRALSAFVDRHDILRMRFVEVDGVPFQRLAPRRGEALEVHDLSGLEGPARQARERELLDACLHRPFRLLEEAVYRFTLLKLEPRRFSLALDIHHICADGISATVLLDELSRDYAAADEAPAAGAARSFVEYLAYEQARWPSDAAAQARRFWRSRLEGLRSTVDFGNAHVPRAGGARGGACRFRFALEPGAFAGVKLLARRTRSTPFIVLAAAFQALLYRYTGQDQINVAYPVNIRPPEWQRQLGCLINYLPLPSRLSAAQTASELIEWLKQVRRDTRPFESFPHLEIAGIVRELQHHRDRQVFNVAITSANFALKGLELPGVAVTPVPVFAGDAKEDLGLLFDATDDALHLVFEHRRAVVPDELVREMASELVGILAQMSADPSIALGGLALARDAAFADRHAPRLPEPERRDLSAFASELLARSRGEILVAGEGGALSGARVEALSCAIANVLAARGVGPGDRVGVALSRTPLLVPALLGIWKVGAVYVPLDPQLPAQRTDFIVQDAGLSVRLVDAAAGDAASAIDCSLDAAALEASPATYAGGAVDPDDVAYLIYTSGSTGVPKGVEVTRANLVNFLAGMMELLPLGPGDRWLAVTTVGFDISLLELLLPPLSGATVRVCPAADARDAFALKALLQRERITHLQATPSLFRMLLAAGWRGQPELTAMCGGEALDQPTGGSLLESCRAVWNFYGPTETTIWSMAARLDAGSTIHLGRPIRATAIHLLDRSGLPVPRHVKGEIYIGGHGVARGYRGRPELTRERFVALGGRGRCYRTGDLAYRNERDEIVFVGRDDGQVKIRGHRIELGEIESRLEAIAGVRKAAVVPIVNQASEQSLHAFVEAAAGAALTKAGIRAELEQFLPPYMVPSVIQLVEALPLNSSGKLDRRELAAHAARSGELPAGPPRGGAAAPLARELERIYREVLELPSVDTAHSLFELGGHSLTAIRVLSRLRDELGVSLTLRELLERSSIDELARLLTAGDRAAPGEAGEEGEPPAAELELPSGSHRALLSEHVLGDSRPSMLCRAFRLEGPLDAERLRAALERVRAAYLLDRGRVIERGGAAVLEPHDAPQPWWSYVALDAPDALVRELVLGFWRYPLRLARGELFKALLVRRGDDAHVLALATHHGVMDGATCARFLGELSASYAAGTPPRGASRGATRRFVRAERDRLAAHGARSIEHLRERLSGLRYFELPGEATPPPDGADRHGTIALRLDARAAEALASRARALELGGFALAVAALVRALGEAAGRGDVCIGVVHTLRSHAADDWVFGNLTNVLPVRVRDAAGDLPALARAIQDQLVSNHEHAFVPFQELVAQVPEGRVRGRPPLFSIVAVDELVEPFSLGGELGASDLELGFAPNAYGVTMRLRRAGGWELFLDHDATRVTGAAIARVADGVERALQALAGGAAVSRTHTAVAGPDRSGPPGPAATRPARRVDRDEVIRVFARALGLEQLDLERDFVELGGSSITGTRIAAELHARYGLDVPVHRLLGCARLADFVDALIPGERPPEAAAAAPRARPASGAEKALVFMHSVAACKAAYNIPIALRISGGLDGALLARAVAHVVAGHAPLRASFEQTAAGLQRRVRDRAEGELVRRHPPTSPRDVPARLAALIREPFDLARELLVRVHHLPVEDGSDVVLFLFHHAVADGVSSGHFLNDLGRAYQELREGRAPAALTSRAEPPSAAGEDAPSRDARLAEMLAALALEDRILALPYAAPFPEVRTLHGAFLERRLEPGHRRSLDELARALGVPISVLLLGAYLLALHHASREASIQVGLATLNRTPRTFARAGLHTNTVVLPGRVDANERVSSFLERLAGEVFALHEYADLPLQDVVSRVVHSPQLGVTPLFQAFFNFIDRAMYDFSFGDLRAEEVPCRPVGSKFELSLEVHDLKTEVVLCFEYSTDVLDRPTVEAIAALVQRIALALARSTDRSVGRLLAAAR